MFPFPFWYQKASVRPIQLSTILPDMSYSRLHTIHWYRPSHSHLTCLSCRGAGLFPPRVAAYPPWTPQPSPVVTLLSCALVLAEDDPWCLGHDMRGGELARSTLKRLLYLHKHSGWLHGAVGWVQYRSMGVVKHEETGIRGMVGKAEGG
jgi:hypothetical protein